MPLFPSTASAAGLQTLIRSLVHQEFEGAEVIFRHVSSVSVHTPEGFPWTLDGEYGPGAEDVVIKNLPRRLTFLL